ncbi:putative CRISPR-associated endoribonuclease Cas6 [Veillonella atypica ACS-134-V-Col7a]|uniref:Putative CRISPR-associated endoribonuclease Cas6 n=1 Tax=Veillonella atypica ACS-134-V-Col7a TaxID=866778 RepID=E1LC68_9FIRM|nr:CRISPR system precrRNA processing endoribonuclease RAMP protein Cas6 [Veillonella atypica]EFL57783.1 putative CRISPR-associated endoribonuclease Cas6 [Veillonella atypica ACS-134-V-Col7a]
MLATVTLTLQSHNGGSLPQFPGRFLHAAVFSLISSIDEEAGHYWHDVSGIKPFTVTLDYNQPRRNHVIQEGDILFLRINVWHRDLWCILAEISESIHVQIGPLQATIVDIHYETPFGLPLREENILDLVQQRLEAKPARNIEFEFLTPTMFNGTHGDTTFPTAELIFASIVDKWNAGDVEDMLDKPRIKELCKHIILSDWSGHTKRVYFGRDRGYTGFIGNFTFNLSKLSAEENQLITVLAIFGQHCGIGRLSSQGLGQVKVLLKNK